MAFALSVTLIAIAGQEDRVADGLRVLEAASRREPGVIEWRVHRSIDDPRTFLLYELYGDPADLDAHRASDHFAAYQRDVLPLLEDRQPQAWETLTP